MVSEREWTDYIQEDPLCPHLRNRPPSVVSIFRVHKFLKDTKREAYVPQRVSLGPYHHGSAELPPMGHHKGRAVRTMMKRFNANSNVPVVPNNMDFADRARAEILKLENEIRDNYEENIDCDGETLARMLCLDGCFLLEVLRTLGGDILSREEAHKYYDPIFGERKLYYAAKDVQNDLLILENQIPLIVLIKLLELESNSAVDVEKKLLDVVKVLECGDTIYGVSSLPGSQGRTDLHGSISGRSPVDHGRSIGGRGLPMVDMGEAVVLVQRWSWLLGSAKQNRG